MLRLRLREKEVLSQNVCVFRGFMWKYIVGNLREFKIELEAYYPAEELGRRSDTNLYQFRKFILYGDLGKL